MTKIELLELIDDKVNEIYLAYQLSEGIESGDIDPWTAIQLGQMEGNFADFIVKSMKDNKRKKTNVFNNVFVYSDLHGHTGIVRADSEADARERVADYYNTDPTANPVLVTNLVQKDNDYGVVEILHNQFV